MIITHHSCDQLFWELEKLRKENKELKCCGNCEKYTDGLDKYNHENYCLDNGHYVTSTCFCKDWTHTKERLDIDAYLKDVYEGEPNEIQ